MTTRERTWRPPQAARAGARYDFEGSLGVSAPDTEGLIDRIKAGLDFEAFTRLQAALDVTAAVLAGVIGLPTRTLARRKTQGRLSSAESERLVRVARLYEIAVEVLGDDREARRWLKAPRPALGGKTPLERADTEPGAREVEDLLGRIAHGVFF